MRHPETMKMGGGTLILALGGSSPDEGRCVRLVPSARLSLMAFPSPWLAALQCPAWWEWGQQPLHHFDLVPPNRQVGRGHDRVLGKLLGIVGWGPAAQDDARITDLQPK